jgi:hypothetical protein
MLKKLMNKKREAAVEAKAEAKLDELLDDLLKSITDGSLGTLLELKIQATHDGVEVNVGGSTMARVAFCAMGEGYEALYEKTKEQMKNLALDIKEGMEALGAVSETKHEEQE